MRSDFQQLFRNSLYKKQQKQQCKQKTQYKILFYKTLHSTHCLISVPKAYDTETSFILYYFNNLCDDNRSEVNGLSQMSSTTF